MCFPSLTAPVGTALVGSPLSRSKSETDEVFGALPSVSVTGTKNPAGRFGNPRPLMVVPRAVSLPSLLYEGAANLYSVTPQFETATRLPSGLTEIPYRK